MNEMKDAVGAIMRATDRAGRSAVIELLKSFGVARLTDIRLGDVDAFIRRCDALQPEPEAVSMKPAFNIGAHVRPKGRSGFKATVVGYELRYRMKSDHNEAATTHAWHPDKLERVPEPAKSPEPHPWKSGNWPMPEPVPAPQPAKSWSMLEPKFNLEPFYQLCLQYERAFGRDSLVMHLHQLGGVRTASQVKAQDIPNVIARLTHVLSLPPEAAPPQWVW